jgi:hypothetical protein
VFACAKTRLLLQTVYNHVLIELSQERIDSTHNESIHKDRDYELSFFITKVRIGERRRAQNN